LEIDKEGYFIYRSISSTILKIDGENNYGKLVFTDGYMVYKK